MGAPPNILNALTILKRVWDNVSASSVVCCWRKVNCPPTSFLQEQEPPQHLDEQQGDVEDVEALAASLQHKGSVFEAAPIEVAANAAKARGAWEMILRWRAVIDVEVERPERQKQGSLKA